MIQNQRHWHKVPVQWCHAARVNFTKHVCSSDAKDSLRLLHYDHYRMQRNAANKSHLVNVIKFCFIILISVDISFAAVEVLSFCTEKKEKKRMKRIGNNNNSSSKKIIFLHQIMHALPPLTPKKTNSRHAWRTSHTMHVWWIFFIDEKKTKSHSALVHLNHCTTLCSLQMQQWIERHFASRFCSTSIKPLRNGVEQQRAKCLANSNIKTPKKVRFHTMCKHRPIYCR